MELTKEYFDKHLKQLATKTDVEAINRRIDRLPTHDDLAHFATKDDLLQVATHNDIAAVRLDITEVKDLVEIINEREDEDTRAIIRDLSDLKKRVVALEKARHT